MDVSFQTPPYCERRSQSHLLARRDLLHARECDLSCRPSDTPPPGLKKNFGELAGMALSLGSPARASSVSALVFAHPQSHYFSVGQLGRDPASFESREGVAGKWKSVGSQGINRQRDRGRHLYWQV